MGSANTLVQCRIMQEIEALGAGAARDLATRVRRVLRRLLVGGACQREIRLGQIADLVGIHGRTLNRRLRSQNTTFKAHLDETRYEIARQLLRDTRLPVTKIAATLD